MLVMNEMVIGWPVLASYYTYLYTASTCSLAKVNYSHWKAGTCSVMYYYTACGNGIILMQSVQSGRQLIIKICISIYQYTVEVIKLTEIQLRLPNIAHHVRGWLFCL